MARKEAVIQRFDLTAGFVTEFTELTFPANATLDESNFTIENDGSRKRRKGVDYETSYSLHAAVGETWTSGDAVNAFEWRSAGGFAGDNFYVVQVGSILHFYSIGDTFSSSKHGDTIDLTAQKESSATNTEVAQHRVDGAYGRTRFFVVGEFIEPFYITYDGTNFSATSVTIQERDFQGVDDTLAVSERPSSLSSEHLYNLQNQGWPDDKINTFKNNQGVYPSNADIWFFGKYVDTGASGRESFSSSQLVNQDFGNTRAPQGHFIRDIFDTTQSFSLDTTIDVSNFTHDGSTATLTTDINHGLSVGSSIIVDTTSFSYTDNIGVAQTYTYSNETYTVASVVDSDTITFSHNISNFDTSDPDASFDSLDINGNITISTSNPSGDTTVARPASVEFFAGRVWWGGIPDDRLGNKVYFSQIIQYDSQIGKCYQAADPTSEHISDLIDTDGGVITIAEMGQVKKMGVVGKNLVLFADNGIWNVGPGGEGFFTANSFSIRKISNLEITSPEAVIIAEGIPVIWTYQGIYALGEDQVSGFLSPRPLSVETIQTFYRDIPDESKAEAFGIYDDVAKKFHWFYSSDSGNPDKYDKVLLFDARKEAFIKYDIKSITDGPFIAAVARTLGYDSPDNKIKMFTIQEGDGEFTFSNFNETSFHDWKTYDSTGVDADAYLITGYEMADDAAREKQMPQITLLFKKTETGTDANGDLVNPGSCYMQGRWDWTNDINSEKWNPERQVYRLRRNYIPASHPSNLDDGYPVIWSKNKVRGRGKSFNMKLRSEENHDLHLIGWQMRISGGSSG